METNIQPYTIFDLDLDFVKIKQEINQFTEKDWTMVNDHKALILVSVGGFNNDETYLSGSIFATSVLTNTPYFLQLLTSLNTPISRSRIFTIEKCLHQDSSYQNYRHYSIFIPLLNDIEVKLSNICDNHFECICGNHFDHNRHYDQNDHPKHDDHNKEEIFLLSKGKIVIFKPNQIVTLNNIKEQKNFFLHIELREMISKEHIGIKNSGQLQLSPYIFEVLNQSEIEQFTKEIALDLKYSDMPSDEFINFTQKIEMFKHNWTEAFEKFGNNNKGERTYRHLLLELYGQVAFPLQKKRVLRKGRHWLNVMLSMFDNLTQRANIPPVFSIRKAVKNDFFTPKFFQPIFIVSAPRSGSTLLFETLSQFKEIWTIGEEGHEILEGIPALHASNRNYSSNRLTEKDADDKLARLITQRFTYHLRNRESQRYLKLENPPEKIRFLEKNPKNSLRIPFLNAIFPDALFIQLHRERKETIASLIEGWRSRKFISYRSIPDWRFREWSFLLPEGWRELENSSFAEIAAYQYKSANEYIIKDIESLSKLNSNFKWCLIDYEDLIQHPKDTVEKIGRFANLTWDNVIANRVSGNLPISGKTLSAPDKNKWRKYKE